MSTGDSDEANGLLPLTDPFVPQVFDPDSSDGLRVSLSWWLVATGRLWRKLLDERLRAAGQTQPRWRVLAWARMRPGITQTELAQRMGIAGPTLVRILDSLNAQSLIERRENAGDRRVKEVHLTAQAEPLVRKISQEVRIIRHALLDGVRDEDLRVCLDVLEHIRARAAEVGNWPASRLTEADLSDD
jgi:MarR family transcriptional regulator for hemolysin